MREIQVYIRPAQVGDVCVLLEPADRREIDLFRQRQAALRARFGGTPIVRPHLTCQRFACRDERRVRAFARDLGREVETIPSFPLTALALQTLYVPVLETNILKWEIQVTEELRRLSALVARALARAAIGALYIPGFVSSLLAALRDVPEPGVDELARVEGFPHPLYTVGQVALSRIEGPDAFEILDALPLAAAR